MNGYQLMADSYKQLLKQENWSEEQKKEIKSEIRVHEVLATFTQDEKYIAFDSSMFNDIFKGYVEIITEDLDELTKKLVRERSRAVLDQYTAKQAEDQYRSESVGE